MFAKSQLNAEGARRVEVAAACKLGRLSVKAARGKGCGAGAVLVRNDRDTELADLAEIETPFFALVDGSPGAEGIFLNQDLAIRAASVLRDLHAHFLSPFSLCPPRPRRRAVRSPAPGQIPQRYALWYRGAH
jgi:hypothetical protein